MWIVTKLNQSYNRNNRNLYKLIHNILSAFHTLNSFSELSKPKPRKTK